MPKPEQPNLGTFLADVRRQLTGLDFAEQREILEELSTHLQDAVALREAEGLDPDEAHARAIASMGDPESVGRRLRAEHLSRRLSVRDSVLALLPLLVIVWAFSHASYIGMVRQAGAGPNNSVDVIFGNLLPVLAIAALGLWRTRQVWSATLLGGAGVFGLLGASRVLGVTSHSGVSLVGFALAGLMLVPLAFGFTLRWGNLHASLAILSGVMSYGLLAWFTPDLLWPSILLAVLPVIGIAAVCLTPRRWQIPVTWAALVAEWLADRPLPAPLQSLQRDERARHDPVMFSRFTHMFSPAVAGREWSSASGGPGDHAAAGSGPI